MVLTQEQKQNIKQTLSNAYSEVGDTGYDMKKCFVGQRKGGNITINYECAKRGGEAIGDEMKALWGKR